MIMMQIMIDGDDDDDNDMTNKTEHLCDTGSQLV